ncbi:hypothetical protein GCM10009558_091750 [Virgisporangium aurantiacum]
MTGARTAGPSRTVRDGGWRARSLGPRHRALKAFGVALAEATAAGSDSSH